MEGLQLSCPGCIRLRYGHGQLKDVADGTLKKHTWSLYTDEGKMHECDFCNNKFRYLWARKKPQTASRQGH